VREKVMAEGLRGGDLAAFAGADVAALPHWLLYGGDASPTYRLLVAEARERLRERAAAVARLQTAAQWRERQGTVRRALDEIVGPFPERTPLNARITGVVQKRGYRIEKLVFEAQPRYYVTGCVFVPDGLQGRAPAILNAIGHTDIAFRGHLYQQMILNLVAKGFVVLAYDPAGQGERLQYFEAETGVSRIGWSVREHFYAGDQCFLAGSSLARYCVWDGMRAIDYLQSRDDVDPGRIGVTGISGGGTRTAYIAACDERVAAASPCCYIAGFRRLLESIGPQDAEQVMAGSIAAGIDHADLLEMMAPKPVLIAAATRDFFSIQGARETFAEVKGAYEALGAPANLEMVEDDLEHGYSRVIREATYGFFQRVLRLPGEAAEVEVEYLSMEDLTVTPTGQLLTSLGGETVFSLNKAEAARLPAAAGDVGEAALRLSGYRDPGEVEAAFIGRHNHDGFSVEQYLVAGEGEYRLPLTVAVPHPGNGRVVLYVDNAGRKAAMGTGLAERLLRCGYTVAAGDVSSVGELAGAPTWASFAEAYVALLLRRSVVGLQAGDVVRLVRALQQRRPGQVAEVAVVGEREMCPAVLHAAAAEKAIARVALIRPLVSYRAVVESRFYRVHPNAMVPAALEGYDLPDLMGDLAPRPLLVLDAANANEAVLPQTEAERQLASVRTAYAAMPRALTVRAWGHEQQCFEAVENWLG
jgi:dienelactone hydrolase